MPTRRNKFLQRARINVNDLTNNSLRFVPGPTQHPRIDPRLGGLLNKITEKFEQYFLGESIERCSFVPATEFEIFNNTYSKKTVIKAKKLLGIKSIRSSFGIWMWTPPTRTRDEAETFWMSKRTQLNERMVSRIARLSRNSAKDLQSIMKENGYFVKNEKVLRKMKELEYSHTTIMHCKKDLGIISQKVDIADDGVKEWYWLWAPYPVKEAMEQILTDGPRDGEFISAELKKRNISPELLIHIIATYRPTFYMQGIKGRVFVRSVNEERNITIPEADTSDPVELATAPRNEIEIDFSDEPTSDDEYVPMNDDYWIN